MKIITICLILHSFICLVTQYMYFNVTKPLSTQYNTWNIISTLNWVIIFENHNLFQVWYHDLHETVMQRCRHFFVNVSIQSLNRNHTLVLFKYYQFLQKAPGSNMRDQRSLFTYFCFSYIHSICHQITPVITRALLYWNGHLLKSEWRFLKIRDDNVTSIPDEQDRGSVLQTFWLRCM